MSVNEWENENESVNEWENENELKMSESVWKWKMGDIVGWKQKWEIVKQDQILRNPKMGNNTVKLMENNIINALLPGLLLPSGDSTWVLPLVFC